MILAHEWGHEIMFDVGWRGKTVLGQELFADCLAGMYTRWGITVSHKLNNADYTKGWYALRSIANNGDHGTAKNRSDWYAYGYSQYNIDSCYQALYNSDPRPHAPCPRCLHPGASTRPEPCPSTVCCVSVVQRRKRNGRAETSRATLREQVALRVGPGVATDADLV